MKNFVQTGVNLTIAAPAAPAAPAAMTSGGVVIVGALRGIAAADATEGQPVDVVTEGVFALPKVAADAFAIGDTVFYDAAEKLVSATGAEPVRIGYAVEAAAAGSAQVNVKLT